MTLILYSYEIISIFIENIFDLFYFTPRSGVIEMGAEVSLPLATLVSHKWGGACEAGEGISRTAGTSGGAHGGGGSRRGAVAVRGRPLQGTLLLVPTAGELTAPDCPLVARTAATLPKFCIL